MDEVELMKKGQGAEGLDRQLDEDAWPFVAHGVDDVTPFDELEREARKPGAGRRVELVDFDEVGMVEAREGRELASESLDVLRRTGRGELFQREVVARAVPVLDEPDPSGSALAEDPLHLITVAGTLP